MALFNLISIDEPVQKLIKTYQENWGELYYDVFIPNDSSYVERPTMADVCRVILENEIISPDGKDRPKGQIVTVDEFLGNYLEMYERKQQSDNNVGCYTIQGYEFAFFSPPYGIRLKFEKAVDIFNKLNIYLFGEMSEENLQIIEWDCTSLSNYFINEWWDFCWAVWSNEKKWLVLIYGTATD
ncbi:MAG: hypothetical protein GY797_08110 [Deltaproteobacteria bacterium]|nr:hypothetical protein [Deltaproteobacteria bacterium]